MRKIIQIYMGDVCTFYAEEVKIMLYSIRIKRLVINLDWVHFFMLNKTCTQAPEEKVDRKCSH